MAGPDLEIQYYVLLSALAGEINPRLVGPYADETQRDLRARAFHDEGTPEEYVGWLDVSSSGVPTVGSYPLGFFT